VQTSGIGATPLAAPPRPMIRLSMWYSNYRRPAWQNLLDLPEE
jgi:hypothetical protein